MQNSVVLENQNHLYDASMVQLLTTQNIEGPSTSGSNMLTSLRKDTGLSTGILRGSQAPGESENFALLPVTPATYAKNDMAAATSVWLGPVEVRDVGGLEGCCWWCGAWRARRACAAAASPSPAGTRGRPRAIQFRGNVIELTCLPLDTSPAHRTLRSALGHYGAVAPGVRALPLN